MGDFDCCKDGKCDDYIQQVEDGIAAAIARPLDVEVFYGTEPTA